MSTFHIKITEFTGADPDDGIERLSINVDDNPTMPIMRLLSAKTRGPRKKSGDNSRKPAGETK